nr:hypothetical protein [Tanacetum cinerariifolium]
MWLKGRVNKDGEFTDDEIRSVEDKLKEPDDKIKEGTLNLDNDTDAMTVVFGKEKGGYVRGVGSGVTYKRRERQEKDVVVKKLSTEMTEKYVLVKKLSNEMTETKGMLSQLINQLATQGVQLNLSSQLQVASNFDGKQMLHNQALPNDCYKVSINSSLVDAACIRDVGNIELKTVKDGVGGFFAWPKNQVALDEEVTPPTMIQKIND